MASFNDVYWKEDQTSNSIWTPNISTPFRVCCLLDKTNVWAEIYTKGRCRFASCEDRHLIRCGQCRKHEKLGNCVRLSFLQSVPRNISSTFECHKPVSSTSSPMHKKRCYVLPHPTDSMSDIVSSGVWRYFHRLTAGSCTPNNKRSQWRK